jgi:NTP pyrophosphatase (non-canonical NTP hydrolase)
LENFNDYQEKAASFRVANASNEERVMGLLEEAGEVAGVFKRFLRGDYSEDMASSKLFKELGDVLFYVSQIAKDNGWKFSEIAQGNIDKLESRQIRGLILGSGDDR